MMGAHSPFQVLATRHGVSLSGPGGTIVMSNQMLATVAEFSVGLLDIIQHDPDAESDGDEADGNRAEDDFMEHGSYWGNGPGCPIADPGGCDHDGREPEEAE